MASTRMLQKIVLTAVVTYGVTACDSDRSPDGHAADPIPRPVGSSDAPAPVSASATANDRTRANTHPQHIEITDKAVKSLKSDLHSFQLHLDPSPKVRPPCPALRLSVAPFPHTLPNTVVVEVPTDVAASIIDALADQGVLFRGAINNSKRIVPREPYYMISVQGPQTGPIVSYFEPLSATPDLTTRLQWLRDLIPAGGAAKSMERFMKQLEAATAEN